MREIVPLIMIYYCIYNEQKLMSCGFSNILPHIPAVSLQGCNVIYFTSPQDDRTKPPQRSESVSIT